jgi:hypothetical protein
MALQLSFFYDFQVAMPLISPSLYHILNLFYLFRKKPSSASIARHWILRRDLTCHFLGFLKTLSLWLFLRNGLLHAYFVLIVHFLSLAFGVCTLPIKVIYSKKSPYIRRVWIMATLTEECTNFFSELSVLLWVFKYEEIGLRWCEWEEIMWAAWFGIVSSWGLAIFSVMECARRVIIKYRYRKNSTIKEITYITAIIVANCSSLSYLLLSIGGELIALEGRLWAVDSF